MLDKSVEFAGGDAGSGLLDVKALSERLGVKPATVRAMKRRGKLPAPLVANLNGGSVWLAEDVDRFVADSQPSVQPVEAARPDADLPEVVDLFAGCGGLSLGFQRAGYPVVVGIDNWPAALDVYSRNMAHPTVQMDLSDASAAIAEVRRWISSNGVIVGGPPCQDFSSAGKRVEGARADLTVNFAEIVAGVRPRAFVMENVERARRALVFEEAVQILREAGYGLTIRVLNAARCGVPQKRNRLFTIGVLGAPEGFLDFAIDAGLAAHDMTLREYFGEELTFDHYYRHPRSYARRAVFSVDEPSPTVRGVNRPVPPGYPGHPGDPVPATGGVKPLSTEMRGRIQTFPKGYYFGASKTAAEQMIGNAVPVELAAYVARHLAAYLRGSQ